MFSTRHCTNMGTLGSITFNQSLVSAAVELFSEHLEDVEIETYLPSLMTALLHSLTVAKRNRSRENCIGAIGSAAQAAKSKVIASTSSLVICLRIGLF